MAFRRYGGIRYSSTNNFVHSEYTNNSNMNITTQTGQPNSKELFRSHIDLSGNSILNVGCIYFENGTVLCSALPLPLSATNLKNGSTNEMTNEMSSNASYEQNEVLINNNNINNSDDEIMQMVTDILPQIVTDYLPQMVNDSLPQMVKDLLSQIVNDSLKKFIKNPKQLVNDNLKQLLPQLVTNHLPGTLKQLLENQLPQLVRNYLPKLVKFNMPELVNNNLKQTLLNENVIELISNKITPLANDNIKQIKNDICYRGKGEITDNISTYIYIPFSTDEEDDNPFAMQITPIYNRELGKVVVCNVLEISSHLFEVFGENCSFYWHATSIIID